MEQSLELYNSDGIRVQYGSNRSHSTTVGAGDIGLLPSQVLYCGRAIRQCRCGNCEGTCGPDDGCPCHSCKALLLSRLLSPDNPIQLRNSDGVLVAPGTPGAFVTELNQFSSQTYYCGRRMNQCRCGQCSGFCGPDNGCPCNSCKDFQILADQIFKASVNTTIYNEDGAIAKLGTNGWYNSCTGGDICLPTKHVFYCGRQQRTPCHCGECDGVCGPDNGCPCNACKRLLLSRLLPMNMTVQLVNGDGAAVFCGTCTDIPAGDMVPIPSTQLFYCGRNMNQCRCGGCDPVCGPNGGCPCTACKALYETYQYHPFTTKENLLSREAWKAPPVRFHTLGITPSVSFAAYIGNVFSPYHHNHAMQMMLEDRAAKERRNLTGVLAENAQSQPPSPSTNRGSPNRSHTNLFEDAVVTLNTTAEDGDEDNSAFMQEDNICVVCLTLPKAATFLHLSSSIGHLACCWGCALIIHQRHDTCPVCRGTIDGIVKVY